MNFKILWLILKTARPRQWIKNLALFTPLLFSGFMFYKPTLGPSYFLQVCWGVFIFSILTSSVYIINDIIDINVDQQHPFKKKRPIASKQLPLPIAYFASISGIIIVFFLSLTMPTFFKLLLFTYLLLQIIYAKKVKNIPILDVISIAAGFLIRIYTGAIIVDIGINVWFLLTVVSASLFLAVGKRQSERTLLAGKLGTTRKTLTSYSQRLLDQYTSMFATATWMSYALFTFQTNTINMLPITERFSLFYNFLPRTMHSEKLLMLTVPLVIFGVMRYSALIFEENRGESPEVVLLRDKTLLTTVLTFFIMVWLIIYV